MPPAMLPVVSIASSTSALGGFAGIEAIFPVSVATPRIGSPARSVNVALGGLRLALVVAATTRVVDSAARATNRPTHRRRPLQRTGALPKFALPIMRHPLSRLTEGGTLDPTVGAVIARTIDLSSCL